MRFEKGGYPLGPAGTPTGEDGPRRGELSNSIKLHLEEEEAMTAHERTIAKILELPEPLLEEVNDFIDFVMVKHDRTRWELWTHFSEALDLAESDFADYLPNLETYEAGLARGDILW
ncbi:MAG: hypothetical protein V2B18_14375 [Pseudomonadota bacterium]